MTRTRHPRPPRRPVDRPAPAPADERRRELERQAERDLASLDYAGGRFWTAADQD